MKGNVGDNGNISIFSDVHPNPLVEDVVQGSEMLRKHIESLTFATVGKFSKVLWKNCAL